MVDELKAARGKEHAGLWSHGAAGRRWGGGIPRAWETKRGRAQGKDINSSHQMQKKGGEGGTKKQSFSTGPPSNAAGAHAARVQTNPQRQKGSNSHSNESSTPSSERLFVSRSLWGMYPPPRQPQPLPFRLGRQ